MTIKQLVDRKNFDGIGKYFLSTGMDFFLKKELSKSYEMLRQGLQILTCDCIIGNWKKEVELSLYNFPSFTHNDINEFNFCKSFVLSYNDDLKSNYVALDHIEQFLDVQNNDSIGWYIKGKIFTNLERYDEALYCYDESLELESSSRTLYRIGRLKEQKMGEYGIDELYSAYLDNQSSICCCRVLQQYSFIRGIKIKSGDSYDNILIHRFNNYTDPWNFHNDLDELIRSRENLNLFQETASEMILSDFIRQLLLSNDRFIMPEEEEDDYDYEEDYLDNSFYENDYEEMYFDAMTDGQLGSFDEFVEKGGNTDWIDDWAGR